MPNNNFYYSEVPCGTVYGWRVPITNRETGRITYQMPYDDQQPNADDYDTIAEAITYRNETMDALGENETDNWVLMRFSTVIMKDVL